MLFHKEIIFFDTFASDYAGGSASALVIAWYNRTQHEIHMCMYVCIWVYDQIMRAYKHIPGRD
jgi:hypothetical protein